MKQFGLSYIKEKTMLKTRQGRVRYNETLEELLRDGTNRMPVSQHDRKPGDGLIKLDNIDYDLIEFTSDDLIFAKHPEASSSAYIDFYDKNIFLATATGQITYSKITNLSKNDFKLVSIKSNIQELIKYSEFYNSSAFGIKDILVKDLKNYDEILLVGSGKGVASVKMIKQINWKRKNLKKTT